MGRIEPKVHDLIHLDEPFEGDETQPCTPARVYTETVLNTDPPLSDDVDRLLEHFEDTQFIRDWAYDMRRIIRRMRSQAQPY